MYLKKKKRKKRNKLQVAGKLVISLAAQLDLWSLLPLTHAKNITGGWGLICFLSFPSCFVINEQFRVVAITCYVNSNFDLIDRYIFILYWYKIDEAKIWKQKCPITFLWKDESGLNSQLPFWKVEFNVIM